LRVALLCAHFLALLGELLDFEQDAIFAEVFLGEMNIDDFSRVDILVLLAAVHLWFFRNDIFDM